MILGLLLVHLGQHPQLIVDRGGPFSDCHHVNHLLVHRRELAEGQRKRHPGVFILVGRLPDLRVERGGLDRVGGHPHRLRQIDAVRVEKLHRGQERHLPETHHQRTEQAPLRHAHRHNHVAHVIGPPDENDQGYQSENHHRPERLGGMTYLEGDRSQAVRLLPDLLEHVLDLRDNLDLRDDKGAQQDRDHDAGNEDGLANLLLEMQIGTQSLGEFPKGPV